MEFHLEKKVVLVTGANGGIGLEICKKFLLVGATVVAIVRGSAEKMAPLYDFCKNQNIPMEQVFTLVLDQSNPKKVSLAVRGLIDRFGEINVLVNNAGAALEKPFVSTTDLEWQKSVDVNLTNPVRLTRAVLPWMISNRNGSVINISSVVGSKQGRGTGPYGVAKAGIDRMTTIVAQEVGKKGVRVNAIAPGLIETKMSRGLQGDLNEYVLSLSALRKPGKPQDIAAATLFLASETLSSFITGQVFYVDGGIGL